jgi:DsbC/DsbD-like thiol-disulfide interchange protein
MSAIAIRIACLAAFMLPSGALAAHSGWTEADEAQLRVLLGAPTDGGIAGGIEIVLEPGWHTYWRNPGESGVPPVFDFSGSENVAKVDVRYPAPTRYDDGGSVSLVYTDQVVFPLVVLPRDAGRPVTLRVHADFGVCSDVCIPTRASAEVESSPAPDPLAAARIASFEPRVPRAPEPGRFDIEAVQPEENALVIDVRMPDSSYTDLFADPPKGWFIGQPTFVERSDGVSRYRLPLAGRPADAPLTGQTFTFVAVSGGEAIEKAVEIR